MRMRPVRFLTTTLVLTAMVAGCASHASAWTEPLMQSAMRDARRLLPRTLAALLNQREPQIAEEMARFPIVISQGLAQDLRSGRLQSTTLLSLDTQVARVKESLDQRRVSEGLVRLGALARIPADLSDPILTVGIEGYPPGVAGEYYAFISENLDKIPVVLSDEQALRLGSAQLTIYWQSCLDASRRQSPLLRSEMFRNGRVVDRRAIDFRSPVFSVASLSYSRAVTAIAGTWLSVWRAAGGDLTRMGRPVEVKPSLPKGAFTDLSKPEERP
ncbi:MAG: hypothetical protein MUF51_05890 [Vicinamibacteria bacterium]|jgi:hypothetical protein|nr:hypothetical protein [Vicinamibacteria bacterium]